MQFESLSRPVRWKSHVFQFLSATAIRFGAFIHQLNILPISQPLTVCQPCRFATPLKGDTLTDSVLFPFLVTTLSQIMASLIPPNGLPLLPLEVILIIRDSTVALPSFNPRKRYPIEDKDWRKDFEKHIKILRTLMLVNCAFYVIQRLWEFIVPHGLAHWNEIKTAALQPPVISVPGLESSSGKKTKVGHFCSGLNLEFLEHEDEEWILNIPSVLPNVRVFDFRTGSEAAPASKRRRILATFGGLRKCHCPSQPPFNSR